MPRTLTLVALLASIPALLGAAQDVPVSRLECATLAAPSDTSSGRVGLLAIGPGGRIAFTEGGVIAPQIRDVRGRVRPAGRTGAGPGEFEGVSAMGWIGDTLWVSDSRTARMQFFSETGAFVRGARTPPRAGWMPRPDGRLVAFAPWPIAPLPTPYAALAVRPGADVPDTIRRFARIEPTPVLVPVGNGEVPNPHPFLPRTIVGNSPTGARFCAALPESGQGTRLLCVDDRGSVVLDRLLTLSARPLTDAVYDSVVRVFSAAPGRTPEMMRDRISRPRTLPPVMELLVQDDGAVWLGRSSRFEAQVRWTRLDAAGRVRSDVVLPARQRVLSVRGDSVWLAVPDADNLETIAGCRVRPG